MKKTLGAVCLTALLGSLLAPAAPALAGPRSPEVQVRPAALERGPDSTVPRIEGHRIIEGDVTVRVRGRYPYLLGTSVEGYLVQVERSGRHQVVLVAPGASQRVVVPDDATEAVASDDGATVAVLRGFESTTDARVEVWSTSDGERLASRRGFRGYPSILDVDDEHVLLSSFGTGSRDWRWRTDRVRRLTDRTVYAADLETDRVAYFTADPYLGGCSVVTTLSAVTSSPAPRGGAWRSCRQRVLAFSPDGARIITTHKLADGRGPLTVTERLVDGTKLATYEAGFFFGSITWESPTDVLLETFSTERGAIVRCSEGVCERASDLEPTPRF